MAYDAARQRVLLFGGLASNLPLADTWEWDGSSWTQLQPSSAPSGRLGHVMAYAPSRRRVVLFGGFGGTYLSDTWEWDGSDWTQMTSAVAPPGRAGSALTEDGRGNVVLFGGVFNSGGVHCLSDTWVWNGQWVKSTPASIPAPRESHSMAFDVQRQRVVLSGGWAGTTGLRETWEWDGSNWTQHTPTNNPTADAGHAMAYDVERGRVVLFGGGNWSGLAPDVWEWDGKDWTTRFPATGPAMRIHHGMAYDRVRAKIVLFGGRDQNNSYLADTWEYYTQFPANYLTFGTGCAGSVGTPALGIGGPYERPWMGGTFAIGVSNLPPGNGAVLAFGESYTTWGAVSLPLSLGFLGMTGCTLYTSGEVVVPLANPTGVATYVLSVPNDPTVLGAIFYNQAFVLDPPANPRGQTASNAGAGVVGAR